MILFLRNGFTLSLCCLLQAPFVISAGLSAVDFQRSEVFPHVSYKQCLMGSSVVDCLSQTKIRDLRQELVILVQFQLLPSGIAWHENVIVPYPSLIYLHEFQISVTCGRIFSSAELSICRLSSPSVFY